MPPLPLLIFLSLLVIIVNLPFGYWRAGAKRYSMQWYLAIHLPVPLIILLRIYAQAGWHWSSYVMFVIAFMLGQFSGGRLYRVRRSASSSGGKT